MEWALLSLWDTHLHTFKKPLRTAIVHIWLSFYLTELDRFYSVNAPLLSLEHGLDSHKRPGPIDTVASAVVSYWHIARIGILACGYSEIKNHDKDEQTQKLNTIADWLTGLLNANSSATRPLIDLHHIEIFLIWRTFIQLGRHNDIYNWILKLKSYLFLRRIGRIPIPFIEGGNSIELVMEYVATSQKPMEFCDQTSLLILMLMELCFSFEQPVRDELIMLIYQQIVLGHNSNNEPFKGVEPLDLVGWLPPKDWEQKILEQSLSHDGESQTLLMPNIPNQTLTISSDIIDFVKQCRSKRQPAFSSKLPISVIVLACLKHRSPLPPELWRCILFQDE